METLVAVEGRRGALADAFETPKTALGLDEHNEIRSWHGSHRHVSLVMLAFAMLVRRAPSRKCAGATEKGAIASAGAL
jgi:SRSO17 transposase